jgi:hypothetical protein
MDGWMGGQGGHAAGRQADRDHACFKHNNMTDLRPKNLVHIL